MALTILHWPTLRSGSQIIDAVTVFATIGYFFVSFTDVCCHGTASVSFVCAQAFRFVQRFFRAKNREQTYRRLTASSQSLSTERLFCSDFGKVSVADNLLLCCFIFFFVKIILKHKLVVLCPYRKYSGVWCNKAVIYTRQ